MIPDSISAYAAGFFDGEGTVCISKSTTKGRRFCSYAIALKIPQKKRAPLEFLQSVYGGTIYLIRRRGISVLYNLTLMGKDRLPFLESIAPFCIVKKADIQCAIEYLRRKPETKDRSCHISEAERDWRESMFQKYLLLRRESNNMADGRGQFEFPVTLGLFSDKHN